MDGDVVAMVRPAVADWLRRVKRPNPEGRLNAYAAQKLFDLLQASELAFQMNGEPHAQFLARKLPGTVGQVRRELRRIVALGPDAGVFVDVFLREFGA